MDTPNVLKGHLYPSSRVVRCPRWHRCIISQKCQNYNPHQLDCRICESRCRPANMLGGILAEGELIPDLQDAIHTIEQNMNMKMIDPDREAQTIDTYDITKKYEKVRKSTEMLAHFMKEPNRTLEEKAVEAMVDPEIAKLLGRME